MKSGLFPESNDTVDVVNPKSIILPNNKNVSIMKLIEPNVSIDNNLINNIFMR